MFGASRHLREPVEAVAGLTLRGSSGGRRRRSRRRGRRRCAEQKREAAAPACAELAPPLNGEGGGKDHFRDAAGDPSLDLLPRRRRERWAKRVLADV